MKGGESVAYVVKSDRHYTNGKSAVLYHKRFSFLHECTVKPKEALQFKTKKEAEQCAEELGPEWYVEKM